MKKFFVLFAILIGLTVNSFAQESATFDKEVGYTESWFSYFPLSTARAHTATDSIWYYTVKKDAYCPVKWDIKVKLHKVSGTAKVTPVVLKAKVFNSDTYVALDTIVWTSGVDTTIKFVESTTYKQYVYFQTYIKSPSSGTVITVPELSMKFWQ